MSISLSINGLALRTISIFVSFVSRRGPAWLQLIIECALTTCTIWAVQRTKGPLMCSRRSRLNTFSLSLWGKLQFFILILNSGFIQTLMGSALETQHLELIADFMTIGGALQRTSRSDEIPFADGTKRCLWNHLIWRRMSHTISWGSCSVAGWASTGSVAHTVSWIWVECLIDSLFNHFTAPSHTLLFITC